LRAVKIAGLLGVLASALAQGAFASEAQNAPAPSMDYSQMAQAMEMDDTQAVAMLWLDQLEWRRIAGQSAAVWQGEGWYGGDYNKLWARSESEAYARSTEDARVELFWDHVIARWWSADVGARQDLGVGPQRSWAAFGVRGLAPQGVNVEATVYGGEASRTAARLKLEYELLFTQRLILQSEAEMNLYGEADRARRIGAGLSDLELGLRLRYELDREWAPYAGLVWARHLGGTATLLRAAGGNPNELEFAIGLRVWL
jgi:copper resistance protein B